MKDSAFLVPGRIPRMGAAIARSSHGEGIPVDVADFSFKTMGMTLLGGGIACAGIPFFRRRERTGRRQLAKALRGTDNRTLRKLH